MRCKMVIAWDRSRSLTVRQIINALLKDGFYLRRQKGSHQRYQHPDGRRITVTFHHFSDTFPPKTLKSMIQEQARWTEEDLQRLGLF
ncbi:MAG: type II toxin-antitoxin system HicA family toxin [Candidatus Omnitrophota bacterium]